MKKAAKSTGYWAGEKGGNYSSTDKMILIPGWSYSQPMTFGKGVQTPMQLASLSMQKEEKRPNQTAN